MADDNCRYLTVDEERDALDILLQDARADLTAARARIAELDSMLDRSCSAYQDDIEKLSARIAELEDWQRRALAWMRADAAERMAVLCGCQRCAERMRLVKEATR